MWQLFYLFFHCLQHEHFGPKLAAWKYVTSLDATTIESDDSASQQASDMAHTFPPYSWVHAARMQLKAIGNEEARAFLEGCDKFAKAWCEY